MPTTASVAVQVTKIAFPILVIRMKKTIAMHSEASLVRQNPNPHASHYPDFEMYN